MSGFVGVGRGWRIVAAAIVVAGFAMAAPASVLAFTVDDADDAPDNALNGTCDAPGGNGCTLRAAIEEANDTGAMDTIDFSPALLATDPRLIIDESGLGALPPISNPALLDGCSGAVGPPCVTLHEESSGGTVDIFRVTGNGVTIRGFALGNGSSGIFIDGASGTLITGNAIGITTSDAWKGLDLANDGPGIRIRDDASDGEGPLFEGNTIGGDTPQSENLISNNTGPAIEVLPSVGGPPGDPTSDLNLIGRNLGWGNGSLFIDLGGDGFGNPSAQNDGIVAPQITLVAPAFVRGTATPNATILVFQTLGGAGASPSSIISFVGQASATAAGTWTLDAPSSLGSGARITALQTIAENSSELAPAAAVDVTAPALSISAGPSGPTADATPTFSFLADPGSTTSCSIAGVIPFGDCDSDVAFTPAPLIDGPHTFRVLAVDPAGNSTIVEQEFSVDTFIRTAIRRAPGERRIYRRVTYKFRAEEPGDGDDEDRFVEELGASFVCSIDARPFRPCSSPQRYRGLSRGRHLFRVAATDDVGNVDDSPAKDTFMIVRPRRK